MMQGIPANHLEHWWPAVEGMIADACLRGGVMSAADVKAALEARNMQLWVDTVEEDIQAVAITEIITYPACTVADIRIGTGTNRESWEGNRAVLEAWAKQVGCQRMRIEARPGWERIFTDYRKTHVILEKEI